MKGLIFTSLVFVFCLSAGPASAFTISPARYLLTIDPGSSNNLSITVKNDDQQDRFFKFFVTGVKQDEKGRPLFVEGSDEAENWIKSEVDSAFIASGKQKKINFIVNVPLGSDPGSHYAGLVAEPIQSALGQARLVGGQASLTVRLASLVILQVAGTVEESLNITRWQAVKKIIFGSLSGGLKFNLDFKNNGTIELPVAGSVAVNDWRGRNIFSTPLNLGNNLLSKTIRSLEPAVIFDDKIGWPGPYTAQVKITYGKTKQVVSAATSFWYFSSGSLVTGGLIVLLVILLAGWRLRKK